MISPVFIHRFWMVILILNVILGVLDGIFCTSSISSSPAGPKANWVIHKDWKLRKLLGSGAYAIINKKGHALTSKLYVFNYQKIQVQLKKFNLPLLSTS